MNTITRLLLALAVGIMIGSAVTIAGVEDARADTVHHCKEAAHHPAGARWCREHGWTVTPHLVIGPHDHAFTDFKPCPEEDDRRCYWNAKRRGNHHGRSFVHHGHLGIFYGMVTINGRRA